MAICGSYLTLILLSVFITHAICGKMCCDGNCSIPMATGQTLVDYQEDYPGYLRYEKNTAVKVFAILQIKDKEILEVEINGERGYVLPDSVVLYDMFCVPAVVNDTKEKLNNEHKVNNKDKQVIEEGKETAGKSSLPPVMFQGFEVIVDIIDIYYCFFQDYMLNNVAQFVMAVVVIMLILIIIWTSLYNQSLKMHIKQIKREAEKWKSIVHEVEHSCGHDEEISELRVLIRNMADKERKLKLEKEELEQEILKFTKENSQLITEKEYSIKAVNGMKLDLKALEATNDQLEEARHQQEIQQNTYNQQIHQIQKELYEANLQRDQFKSSFQETLSQIETLQSKDEEKIKKELEECKKELMKERARSEVVEEYYKYTMHSKHGVHTCKYVMTDFKDVSKINECQQLKDKIEKLEKDTINMELSYITKLNNEIKESIDRNNALQKTEEDLYQSQREVTECHKRISELELRASPVPPSYGQPLSCVVSPYSTTYPTGVAYYGYQQNYPTFQAPPQF